MVNTLPQPGACMTITCRGSIRVHTGCDSSLTLPPAVLTGSYDARRCYHLSAGTSLIIVDFKACAAQAFFRLPALDCTHGLAALPEDPELDFRSLPAGELSDRERIDRVERFLLRRLNTKKADAMMMSAADHIQSARGSLKISRLCQSMYLSESQFEKRFRRSAGCSAKKYASVVRIHKVITGETEGDDFTGKAYEAGYFDQAHFIRDFKAYTGYTPGRFFKLQKEWRQVIPALGFVAP